MLRREFLAGASLFWIATPEPPTTTKWVERAQMPVARSETPAVAHDGLIYVAGGFGAGSRADRYDPDADQWEQLADLPVETNHPGIAVFQNQVVLAGGYSMDGASSYRLMWAYSNDSDEWEPIGELPAPVGAFGLVELDDSLYLVGGALGSLNGEPSAAVWQWAPGEGRWEERAPLSDPREHLAVVAAGGSIYAVGGRAHGRDSDKLGGAVERFDPGTDAWERLAPLPHPRSGLNGARICGDIVVAGGETSPHVFGDVQMLNTVDGTWSALPDLPVAVHGGAIAALNDRLFAIGGSTAAGMVQNVPTVYALDVSESLATCAF
jgi:N-acetylneuraminic acid mutarotase